MKIRITLLAFIISFTVNAQIVNYLENSPKWRQEMWFGGNGSCLEINNYMYYINGDTTIGNYNYKKVFDRHRINYSWMASPPSYMCEGSTFYDRFSILIRQENNNQGWEDLLYDFDLNVGDTLPLTYNNRNDGIIVTSIDSILVGGSFRKIFNLSEGNCGSGLLIEGVGFNSGLLETFPNAEFPAELLCFTLNDTAYYPYYGYKCDLSLGLTSQKSRLSIKTFPNPIIDQLAIEMNSSDIIDQIMVCDMLGNKRKLKFLQYTGGSIKVDFSDMRAGIYLLQLMNRKAALTTIKVIKK
jgi:hypothetical protein